MENNNYEDKVNGTYTVEHKSCANCKHYYTDKFPDKYPCLECSRQFQWRSQVGSGEFIKTRYTYCGKPVKDIVIQPSHYTNRGMECWDWYQIVMTKEEYHGAMKANVYKYMYRAGQKLNTLEDLKKARAYLTHLIETIEKETCDDCTCKDNGGSLAAKTSNDNEGC